MNKGTKIAVAALAVILCAQTAVLLELRGRVDRSYTDLANADALLSEKTDILTGKVNAMRYSETAAPESDTVQAQVSGHFTATVRAVMPDYCSDFQTPAVAVVTCFQSTPFTVWLGEELTSRLTPGETYVFTIRETTIELPREALDQSLPSPELAIPLYGLLVDSVRTAREGEGGLDTYHFAVEER